VLALGSVVLQNLHKHEGAPQVRMSDSCSNSHAAEGSSGSRAHSHGDHQDHGHTCPHDGEQGHQPENCGICKQLHLANQLILGSSSPSYLVEFVEGVDGRVIAVIRDNRPALATAPPRGPPAQDL
jgi:hypothetical protein